MNVVKQVYMSMIRVYALLCESISQRNKIVFIASFGDNCVPVANELKRRYPERQVIVLYESSAAEALKELLPSIRSIRCDGVRIFNCVPLLVTAQKIVIDNYFAFLGALPKRKACECIQVWHANGAIKTFGSENKANVTRSKADKRRFAKVYDYTDSYVVGSDEMMAIFGRSFGATHKKKLPFGLPRTDSYFDDEQMNAMKEALRARYQADQNKQLLLYAPTYRTNNEIALDIELLRKNHQHQAVLIIKLHPRVAQSNHIVEDAFVKLAPVLDDLKAYYPAVDVIISDYSSIPFEVSLLKKVPQLLFYCYDQQAYDRSQGLQANWQAMLPGAIVTTTAQVSQAITEPVSFDFESYNQKWNTYTMGEASSKLATYLAT